jgi:4-amino-4-deoxy-L-arabinose transferase-like glycosyltransferase
MTLSGVLESKGESRRSMVLAGAVVSAIALSARVPHFDTYPRTNIDESHNAWAGFNWIHEGHPRSWSWHPVYSNTRVLWFSYDYPIVPDAFDHTPFLPLLAGLEATVLGAQTMFDCVLPRIRPLMVLVGTLSVTVFFFLALELVSFRTAFLAATLMATSPLVVFNSRLVKEDGLVQLFLLLAVYAHLRSRRLGGGRSYWVAAVSSGLCAFAKVMGIAVGFALSAVCLAESPRRIRRPAVILAVSLFFASLYPLGGLALDWEAYRRLMAFFSASYPYESIVEKFLVLPRMILEPRISAAVPLVDGWIVLGWLAVFRLHRERAVSVPFVCYLLVLMITVRSTAIWGFYLSPLLPFLCLAAATAMGRALSRMDFLSVFLAIGLGFLPQYVAIPGAPIPGGFRGLAVIAFLPLVPALFRLRRDHPCRAAGRTYLAVLLMVSAVANLHRCITTL